MFRRFTHGKPSRREIPEYLPIGHEHTTGKELGDPHSERPLTTALALEPGTYPLLGYERSSTKHVYPQLGKLPVNSRRPLRPHRGSRADGSEILEIKASRPRGAGSAI